MSLYAKVGASVVNDDCVTCSKQRFTLAKSESVYWNFPLNESTAERGQTALGIPCSGIDRSARCVTLAAIVLPQSLQAVPLQRVGVAHTRQLV